MVTSLLSVTRTPGCTQSAADSYGTLKTLLFSIFEAYSLMIKTWGMGKKYKSEGVWTVGAAHSPLGFLEE